MRDLENYYQNFRQLKFEDTMAFYRKKAFLENLPKHQEFVNVLEVGCGESSIFEYKKFKKCTTVDPIEPFLARLKSNPECYHVASHCCSLEDFETAEVFDLIVASCLLHELFDLTPFLRKIRSLLTTNGIFYVDVPNANSFHRHFAIATGHLKNLQDKTTTQLHMQQKQDAFTKDSLISTLEKHDFNVTSCKGYFIKPFHHKRMFDLIKSGTFTKADLDGFYLVGKELDDFAAEIFAICTPT